MRHGTLNVPGIVGLGAAADLSSKRLDRNREHLSGLRDLLWGGIKKNIPGVSRNGTKKNCLTGILNVSLEGIEGESLMLGLPMLGFSTGSGCASASLKPSPVLKAMGLPIERIKNSVRFTLGRDNTQEEIHRTIGSLTEACSKLRKQQP